MREISSFGLFLFSITTASDDAPTISDDMPKLKQYLTEQEMTDGLRDAYTKKGDRYELNELDSSHSMVVALTDIKQKAETRAAEIDSLTAEKGNLERDLTEAKAKAVPHGYRAVTKEVAELGEAVKSSGISKEELTTLKTENDNFKREKSEAERAKIHTEAADFLGYANRDAFARLSKNLDIAKDGEGKFTVKVGDEQKPLTKEFVQSHEDFAPFLSSLSEKTRKTPFPGRETEPAKDIFTAIRENEKKRAEAQTTRTVDEAFGRSNSGGAGAGGAAITI